VVTLSGNHCSVHGASVSVAGLAAVLHLDAWRMQAAVERTHEKKTPLKTDMPAAAPPPPRRLAVDAVLGSGMVLPADSARLWGTGAAPAAEVSVTVAPAAGSASAAGGSDGARSISITAWEFELDPQDVGVRERWFSSRARPTLARNITSPGVWQAMGVGKMGEYAGVGWYRQQVALPPLPPGGSLWLWIGGAPGGVLRSANVAMGRRVIQTPLSTFHW
jgi:hypothetical protein